MVTRGHAGHTRPSTLVVGERRHHLRLLHTAVLGLAAFISCEPSAQSRADGGDVGEAKVVLDDASPCTDCIVLRQIAVLGDTAGPGYVEETLNAVRDAAGNYWLGQRGRVKVFDTGGRYLRDVGREGAGPLEFGFPAPVSVDSVGRVHILDLRNPRITIVGPQFELVNEVHLPFIATSISLLSTRPKYVANALLETADRLGLPLHIFQGREILHSFGAPSEGAIVSPMELQRVLTTHRDLIYSSDYYIYSLQVWDSAGQALANFVGPPLNATKPLPGAWSKDNPPANRIFALRADGRLVWVLRWVRREDWLSKMVEEVLPDGRVQLTIADSTLSSIFEGRIDVIDVDAGALLATHRQPQLFNAFVADHLVLENHSDDVGIPRVGIWSVDLVAENAH